MVEFLFALLLCMCALIAELALSLLFPVTGSMVLLVIAWYVERDSRRRMDDD